MNTGHDTRRQWRHLHPTRLQWPDTQVIFCPTKLISQTHLRQNNR